jgi:hypothetical protein
MPVQHFGLNNIVAVGEDIGPYYDTFPHNTLYKKVSAMQLWVDILYDYTLPPEHGIAFMVSHFLKCNSFLLQFESICPAFRNPGHFMDLDFSARFLFYRFSIYYSKPGIPRDSVAFSCWL